MEQELPPGIFIPCENLEALKELILKLYDKGILIDETWKVMNTPVNFLDILNDPAYFEKGEICGIVYRKGAEKDLNRNIDDLI